LLSTCCPSSVFWLLSRIEVMKVTATTPMHDTLREESQGLVFTLSLLGFSLP
jgi:hypothetical protein